jgi:hypothetical protein
MLIQYDDRSFTSNEQLNEGKNQRLLIWSFLNFESCCRIFLNKRNENV